MAQRRHHYEAAFEGYLRQRRIPYVAVDEAKKSLLPGSPAGVGGVRVRSERWRTVDLDPRVFERLSEPFSARSLGGCGDVPPALMALGGGAGS